MNGTIEKADVAAAALGRLATGRKQADVHRLAGQFIRASYDASKTTTDNSRHWANADALSAVADGSLSVRSVLRSRARYEVANNSIAKGIVLTLANDLVGNGPRLQLTTSDDLLNRRVEKLFNQWTRAVGLAAKLRTMRKARCQDGEAFAIFTLNPRVPSAVKLDLRLVEADQVTTPTRSLTADEASSVDGIVFDAHGNPVEYHVLTAHPGALGGWGAAYPDNVARVPASNVLHWFRVDRPGQRRGIPDLTPALPLFALLRRFVLATLTAAETAADLSLVMETTSPAGGEAAEVEPWVTMELQRNMAMFSPEGWVSKQLKAEHPSETFAPFRHAIVNEIARCLNMPYNVAAGDSAGYNYASGRLDHQTYFKAIDVERGHLDQVVLDRVFAAWLREAQLVAEYGLFGEIARADWPIGWLWDGREHVDPNREASAQDKHLKNNSTTLATEYAKQGKDWEAELRQRARERDLERELGLTAAAPTSSSGE